MIFKISRSVFTGIIMFIQLALLLLLVWRLSTIAVYFYIALQVLSIITAILIIYKQDNPYFKISWVFLILVLPIFGVVLYLLWGNNFILRSYKNKINDALNLTVNKLPSNKATQELLLEKSGVYSRQSRYLLLTTGHPPSAATKTKYYSPIENGFKELLDALQNAQKYIFIETFILSEDTMWEEIHKILKEKAASGIEIRIIFDDLGSADRIKKDFIKRLKAENISAVCYNRFVPSLNSLMNNRDHRKIFVIDGEVAVTGGFNIADEYVNRITLYGHWKDSMIFLYGSGARDFCEMFLSLWGLILKIDPCLENYVSLDPEIIETGPEENGFVHPYCDSPFNNIEPAKGIYLKLIGNAKDSILITTPYLVLDNELISALCLASISGVKVKILTPKIWDKWYVHVITRSNYGVLLNAGIDIYEYTPGFIHSKLMVVDDEVATVGSVNMDFRSFYLHFECGVWLFNNQTVLDVGDDIRSAIGVSEKITYETFKRRPFFHKFIEIVLRVFEPLM